MARKKLAAVLLFLMIVSVASVALYRQYTQSPTSSGTTTTKTTTTTTAPGAAVSQCLTPTAADYSNQTIPPDPVSGTVSGVTLPVVRDHEAEVQRPMPSDFNLRLSIVMKMRNQEQFDKCRAAISDPLSLDYNHFLNSTTLAPYSPTPGQKSSISSFAASGGFRVTAGFSPLVLVATGNVGSAQSLFGIRINLYRYGDTVFYAADSDPRMPKNFAAFVSGITGLDNFTAVKPAALPPCSGSYCPQGIEVGYGISPLLSGGYNGTGQTVAVVVVPGDPDIQNAIGNFSVRFGLPNVTLDIRYPDGPPSSWDPVWGGEADLDVEAIHAAAPGAQIVVLYDEIDLFNAIDYVATNQLAKIVSNSWVITPADRLLAPNFLSSTDARLALDAAQGVTMLFGTGDDGYTDYHGHIGALFPASDPNVLAVGGTNLALTGCGVSTCAGYGSENGWSGSGGGYSGYFAEPAWQRTSIGVKTGRATPDVAMIGGSPGFQVYISGVGWVGAMGTSLSTPLWAGFLSIALQIKGTGAFGNIAPRIYQLAASPARGTLFHDVMTGSNGYPAAQGWDPVTGWGSPKADALAFALSRVKLTVSYMVSGGGSPDAPTFGYIFNGTSRNVTLTTTPTDVYADWDTAWTVTDPLVGSTGSERWITTQSSGTVSLPQTIIFVYQRQYYVTVLVSPFGAGLAFGAGWANAGANIQVSAVPGTGYYYAGWAGNYTGHGNPLAVWVNGPITETALFNYAVGGTDMIANGGFETGDTAMWGCTVYSNACPGQGFTVESGNVNSGSFALEASGATGGRAIVQYSPDTPLPPLTTDDTFSFAVYLGSENSWAEVSVSLISPSGQGGTVLATIVYNISPLHTIPGTNSSAPSARMYSLTDQPVGSWIVVSRNLSADLVDFSLPPGPPPAYYEVSVAPNRGGIPGDTEFFDDFSLMVHSDRVDYYTSGLPYADAAWITANGTRSGGTGHGWFPDGSTVTFAVDARKTGITWNGTLYTFDHFVWNGVDYGANVTATLSEASNLTAVYSSVGGSMVPVMIVLDPPSVDSAYVAVSVDGSWIDSSQTFQWKPGSVHTIAALQAVSCGAGCRYVFSGWSDNGAQTHTITASSEPATYTASYGQQYELAASADPPSYGSVIVTPALTDSYYGVGVTVQAEVNRAPGSTFDHWVLDGANIGSDLQITISMDAPHTLRAVFAVSDIYVYASSNPPGLVPAPTCSPACAEPVAYGALVVVTAPAVPGWTFIRFAVAAADGSRIGGIRTNGNSVTFAAPASDVYAQALYRYGATPTKSEAGGSIVLPAFSPVAPAVVALAAVAVSILNARRKRNGKP